MNITASDARANLYKLLEQVNDQDEIVSITHKGRTVHLVSEAELGSLQEMAHLLGSRNNARRLYDSLEQAETGQTTTFDSGDFLNDLERTVANVEAQREAKSA